MVHVGNDTEVPHSPLEILQHWRLGGGGGGGGGGKKSPDALPHHFLPLCCYVVHICRYMYVTLRTCTYMCNSEEVCLM